MHVLVKSGLLAVMMLPIQQVGAQTAGNPQPPQITVVGRGEIQVTPDRARIQVGVETEDKNASAASAENSRRQTAVIAAIRALGIPQTAIKTLNYSVQPIQEWNEKERRAIITGYRVSNVVQVDAEKVEQAAAIIDAALKAGANRVAGLEFRLSNPSVSRDAAITEAVKNAQRQAEVAAAAAGGRVVELLELNIGEMERPEPRPMAMAAARMVDQAAPPTPINEGTMTVTVTVVTRWRFVKQ